MNKIWEQGIMGNYWTFFSNIMMHKDIYTLALQDDKGDEIQL